MNCPNQSALEALNTVKWDDIAPKLLRFVIYYMQIKHVTRLPDAMTPQDLVQDIVRRVYLGAYTDGEKGRYWNPTKHRSLLRHLKWIAISDLSSKGLLARKQDNELIYKDSERELDALADPIEAGDIHDPEDSSFSTALKQEIAGATDLENAVAAIELGYLKSADIARETGIAPGKIYELRRRLRRKGLKARERLQANKEMIG